VPQTAAPTPFDAAPPPITEVAPAPGAVAVPPTDVETLPAPATAGTDVVANTAAPAEQEDRSMLPWILGGLALLAALAFLLTRRRRRDDVYQEEPVYEEPVAQAPVTQHVPEPVIAPEPQPPEPQPVAQPVYAAPAASSGVTSAAPAAAAGASILTAPVLGAAVAPAAPSQPAAAAAAAVQQGEPEIDFSIRPRRAGVDSDGARVEFELTVENKGSAPAEDVRVSTWMLASGAAETERALVAPSDHADTPPITIPAGEGRTLQASVGLATGEVHGDAILPIVVAEATYRMADGSHGRATARFAVGVADGEELAHFSTDNPSGLHEGVVARELGETQRG
jgi:LPXTG-motif cell wall-anchored protein